MNKTLFYITAIIFDIIIGMSLVMPDYMLVFASVYSTTWDECVDMYDIFTCAQLEEATGKTFSNATTEPELPSYEENPFFHNCVKDYIKDYDKSESVSRDLCKSLIK